MSPVEAMHQEHGRALPLRETSECLRESRFDNGVAVHRRWRKNRSSPTSHPLVTADSGTDTRPGSPSSRSAPSAPSRRQEPPPSPHSPHQDRSGPRVPGVDEAAFPPQRRCTSDRAANREPTRLPWLLSHKASRGPEPSQESRYRDPGSAPNRGMRGRCSITKPTPRSPPFSSDDRHPPEHKDQLPRNTGVSPPAGHPDHGRV